MPGCMPTPEEFRRRVANTSVVEIGDFNKYMKLMSKAHEESEKTGEDQSVILDRLLALPKNKDAIKRVIHYDANGEEIPDGIQPPKEIPPALQKIVDAIKEIDKKDSM